ncbi:hypothetical protein [Moorena producens]|nr:hypothetical protein [Moorena producens]
MTLTKPMTILTMRSQQKLRVSHRQQQLSIRLWAASCFQSDFCPMKDEC